MSSWFPSWLPGLPSVNISLSSAIQRRFISFVLKRSLGHLLKPGQLDVRQIDSQIGSGYVQVTDLEVDSQAVNSVLGGLPLQLSEGTIGSVTARIPWPNPLTSTIGFSLKSLRLTFQITPKAEPEVPDLSESVASMADSFLHEELTPREEALLHESIVPEARTDWDGRRLPGGLDSGSQTEDDIHTEVDPAGVSLFATLVERLISRFQFDASDTEITIVHPEQTAITLNVSEIRYGTESTHSEGEDAAEEAGEVRKVTVAGFSVLAEDLNPVLPQSPSHIRSLSSPTEMNTEMGSLTHSMSTSISTMAPRPPSPSASAGGDIEVPHSSSPTSSSSSSVGEDVMYSMSQSLAYLPPRSPSPTPSDTSSVYRSAISVAPERSRPPSRETTPSPPFAAAVSSLRSRTPSPPPQAQPSSAAAPAPELSQTLSSSPKTSQSEQGTAFDHKSKREVILSMGSDALVIQLSTGSPQRREDERLELVVHVGLIAVALRPWHIRGLLGMSNATSASSSSRTPSKSSPLIAGSSSLGLDFSGEVKGIVALLLMPPTSFHDDDTTKLTAFFEHPLVPPHLPDAYIRLHLDHLSAASSPILISSEAFTLSSLRLTLEELSCFFVRPQPSDPTNASIIPLLITDHNLPHQYSNAHIQPPNDVTPDQYPELPIFEVLDWTKDPPYQAAFRISSWRTKPRHGKDAIRDLADTSSSAVKRSPAADVSLSLSPASSSVNISIVPLHLFIDLGSLLGSTLPRFLDEVSPPAYLSRPSDDRLEEDEDEDGEDEEEASPAMPRISDEVKRAALKELGLDMDYLDLEALKSKSVAASGKTGKRRKRKSSTTPRIQMTLKLSFVRIEARTPSFSIFPQRSGAVVIDLHSIKATNAPLPSHGLRFAEEPSSGQKPEEGNPLLSIYLKRMCLAYSPVDRTRGASFLSVGPLNSARGDDSVSAQLVPNIKLQSTAKSFAIVVSIPALHADVDKDVFDGLQYWADDSQQLVERSLFAARSRSSTATNSRNTSIIGSRYFVPSQSGSGVKADLNTPGGFSVLQTSVTEGFVRLRLSSSAGEQQPGKALDVLSSDLQALVELNPEGKNATVITVSARDLDVRHRPREAVTQVFLVRTPVQTLRSTPKTLFKVQVSSANIPETTAKETKVDLFLWGCTYTLYPVQSWITDLTAFVKAPPNVFESVIPSERTVLSVKVMDGSLRAVAPNHPGALVLYMGQLEFHMTMDGNSPVLTFQILVPAVSLLAHDDISEPMAADASPRETSPIYWRKAGYARIAELRQTSVSYEQTVAELSSTQVIIEGGTLTLDFCADTMGSVGAFIQDLSSAFSDPESKPPREPAPTSGPRVLSHQQAAIDVLSQSIDNAAFTRVPELGSTADLIPDDLPRNEFYLDGSYGAAAGVREFRDDDLNDFEEDETTYPTSMLSAKDQEGVISVVGGETIRLLRPEGVQPIEHYFSTIPPEAAQPTDPYDTSFRLCIHNAEVALLLYDGYDWARTRRTIEKEVKAVRIRLTKIKQLVAKGQTQDPIMEETGALLFNSIYVGLDRDVNDFEPDALVAAIDEELNDDLDETATQSSWQSLPPLPAGTSERKTTHLHGKRLARAKEPSIEIRLSNLEAEVDNYHPNDVLISRTFATVKDIEILDHIKTSTWAKFLTGMHSDSRGNVRETDSNMVKIEIRTVRSAPGHSSEEARLKAKILPLRLHVDQDALDFFKAFFSFKDPHLTPPEPEEPKGDEIYFQHAEIFPVDLKLDYKPRRVNYRLLREGRTIELMNFFHFDGAEMTLRHITLAGITGWPRLFDLLNDLWTPDVKATQLVDVISGVSPIRSVVNVGSGIADLVLLPIAQYKKDGRVVHGVQKGATAFVKSTATEAIKLGARLATGTQVILEQTEGVLGGHGQFQGSVTAEALQSSVLTGADESSLPHAGLSEIQGLGKDEMEDLISKYADQPADVKEGIRSAYRSMRQNLNSAAQTILAVPMEVYERSGSEGPVRSVIRAVPIAVLRPMIGASEAVSKTLLGLHNTLDPSLRQQNEAKYKHR